MSSGLVDRAWRPHSFPAKTRPVPRLAVVLASRVDEIIEHHHDRLQQLLAMIAERPQHAYDMTIQYFGARLKSDEAKRMAVAEVLSHLEYLRARGKGRPPMSQGKARHPPD